MRAPWQSSQVAPGRSRACLRFACMVRVRLLGSRVTFAQVIFLGGVSCARLFTSLWQSTHLNMRPWNGVLQLILVDIEADLLAIFFFRQRSVAVAGEAVGILEFLRGAGSEMPKRAEIERALDTGFRADFTLSRKCLRANSLQ